MCMCIVCMQKVLVPAKTGQQKSKVKYQTPRVLVFLLHPRGFVVVVNAVAVTSDGMTHMKRLSNELA